MIVAAGDIGRCTNQFLKDDSTAKLVRGVPAATVLTLGDHAFPRDGSPAATSADYTDCYGPNWGQADIKSRTLPAAGDLDTLNAFADYFGFFGDVARGPNGKGYYSTDIGEWHIIALNSSIPMDVQSDQYNWLKNDLSLNTKDCTLAYWHFPRYSSYGTTPVRGSVKPLWDALYAAGADVILNAHLRGYERFAPQRPDNTLDLAFGIRQFIVGTGGFQESALPNAVTAPNSERTIPQVNGVLVMTLNPGGYEWEFKPRGGATVDPAETGSGSCHASPLPIAKPGGPYQSEDLVEFDGRKSSDPQGDPITYEWDFGDGSEKLVGDHPSPSHDYATDGPYTVSLTVVDANGDRSATATTQVTIHNHAPIVSAGVDQWAQAGANVGVRSHFTDLGADDGPWAFTIEWGDGTRSTGEILNQDAPVIGSHAYAAVGGYTVTVLVADVEAAVGSDQFDVTVSNTAAPAQVLVGAGDIAQCTNNDDEATAKLLDVIDGTVFTVGDNAYPDGTADEYARCYDPTWGRHKARTYATIGNHEYHTPNATPTFDYFGPRVGPRGKGYYSYDVGAWHVVVLNSNDGFVPYTAGSPQLQWLKDDLAQSGKRCTIAMWHHPRFWSQSTGEKGQSNKQKILWDELYARGVELILVGHNHHYERFRPMNPAAEVDDEYGIRQIIVGTGGDGGGAPIKAWETTEAIGISLGVLKLTLEPDKYSWDFIGIPGQTFTDQGSGTCHDPKGTNRAPVALDDVSSGAEDTPQTIQVLANDTDADGDALTGALVDAPAHGDVSQNSDGSFTYVPGPQFNGTDQFTYTVSDGKASSAGPATVRITVTPTNDAPEASGDNYATHEDIALTVANPGVLHNDGDIDGDVITVSLASGPAHGSLTLNENGSFIYTPNPNFHGSDAFAYRVSDGVATSGIVSVALTVNSVNDAPVAEGNSYVGDEDRALSVAAPGVLGNDTDVDPGQTLQAILASGPTRGTLTLNTTGSFTYTPNVHFSGSDAFSYRASDGLGISEVATVTITVTPRTTAKLDIIPGSSTNTVSLGGSQTQIVFALISSATFDATLIDPAKVTVGNGQGAEAPLARNANGTFKFFLVDVTGDGRRDFYAYVNKAPLRNNGDLTLATTSLTVLGGLKAPSTILVRGTDMVRVIP